MSKIEDILLERNMTQGDLIRLIQDNTGHKIGRDRISMICTGRVKNYTIKTAKMISDALKVSIDSFVELKVSKKKVSKTNND
jgi:transcriptional regulator with XRE-family HTH domain